MQSVSNVWSSDGNIYPFIPLLGTRSHFSQLDFLMSSSTIFLWAIIMTLNFVYSLMNCYLFLYFLNRDIHEGILVCKLATNVFGQLQMSERWV